MGFKAGIPTQAFLAPKSTGLITLQCLVDKGSPRPYFPIPHLLPTLVVNPVWGEPWVRWESHNGFHLCPLSHCSASPSCATLGKALPSLVVTHILDVNIRMGGAGEEEPSRSASGGSCVCRKLSPQRCRQSGEGGWQPEVHLQIHFIHANGRKGRMLRHSSQIDSTLP